MKFTKLGKIIRTYRGVAVVVGRLDLNTRPRDSTRQVGARIVGFSSARTTGGW